MSARGEQAESDAADGQNRHEPPDADGAGHLDPDGYVEIPAAARTAPSG
mgnify:CR=1 FL=1